MQNEFQQVRTRESEKERERERESDIASGINSYSHFKTASRSTPPELRGCPLSINRGEFPGPRRYSTRLPGSAFQLLRSRVPWNLHIILLISLRAPFSLIETSAHLNIIIMQVRTIPKVLTN